jgi:hypothetical protein
MSYNYDDIDDLDYGNRALVLHEFIMSLPTDKWDAIYEGEGALLGHLRTMVFPYWYADLYSRDCKLNSVSQASSIKDFIDDNLSDWGEYVLKLTVAGYQEVVMETRVNGSGEFSLRSILGGPWEEIYFHLPWRPDSGM